MWRVVLLAATLSGCVTAEEHARLDDGKCQGYGAQPGSPAYVQCRAQLDSARTMAEAAPVAMAPGITIPAPVPSARVSRVP